METRETGWTTDLETGVEILDRQHRRYFDLLNSYLAKAAESSTDSGKEQDLAEKFDFLRQYAKRHFSTEESVMTEAGYPDIELHKEEHRYFLKHVRALYDRMSKNGYSPSLAREVNYYTAEWFIEHIRVTDMKFVAFLKQKPVEEKKTPIFLKRLFQSLFGSN